MDIKDLSYCAKREFCSFLRAGMLEQLKKDIENKITHRIPEYEQILEFLHSNFNDLYSYAYEEAKLEEIKKIKQNCEGIE